MYYKKLGPFITQAMKNGAVCYTSRELRKSLFSSKRELSSWIATLFMIGSFWFAFASFSSLDIYPVFSTFSISIFYFIGSIFFTSAAYLQYLESINFDITHLEHLYNKHSVWFWWRFRPYNLGYVSSATQFVGTLLFNLSTFSAIFISLSMEIKNLLVWIPNLLGSILFLTSSFLAYLEVCHDKNIKIFRSTTWWIIWINIFGSIFFQISALYSAYFSQSTQVEFIIATVATFLGAVCFFIAALLSRYEKA